LCRPHEAKIQTQWLKYPIAGYQLVTFHSRAASAINAEIIIIQTVPHCRRADVLVIVSDRPIMFFV